MTGRVTGRVTEGKGFLVSHLGCPGAAVGPGEDVCATTAMLTGGEGGRAECAARCGMMWVVRDARPTRGGGGGGRGDAIIFLFWCRKPVGRSKSLCRAVGRNSVHCTLYTVHCTLYTAHCKRALWIKSACIRWTRARLICKLHTTRLLCFWTTRLICKLHIKRALWIKSARIRWTRAHLICKLHIKRVVQKQNSQRSM